MCALFFCMYHSITGEKWHIMMSVTDNLKVLCMEMDSSKSAKYVSIQIGTILCQQQRRKRQLCIRSLVRNIQHGWITWSGISWRLWNCVLARACGIIMMNSAWRQQRHSRKLAHTWSGQVVHSAWALFYISATQRRIRQWGSRSRYWWTHFIHCCRWKSSCFSCAGPAGERRTLIYASSRWGFLVAELTKVDQN